MRLAELIWVIAVFFLLTYETYALATGHMTLSRAIWMMDRERYGPLLPFLVGILCGHFFWSGQ